MGNNDQPSRRCLRVSVLLVLLFGVATAMAWSQRERLRRWVAWQIAENLRPSCVVETLDVWAWPPRIVAGGLECDGILTRVELLELIPALRASVGGFGLGVSVRAEGVRVDLRLLGYEEQMPHSSIGEPPPPPSLPIPSGFTVEITDAVLRLPYPGASDVQLEAEKLQFRARVQSGGEEGWVDGSSAKVSWRRDQARVDVDELEAELSWDARGLHLHRGRVRGGPLELTADSHDGEEVTFSLRATVPAVNAFVALPDGMTGTVLAQGRLSGDLADPTVAAALQVDEVTYRAFAAGDWSAYVVRNGPWLEFTRIRGRWEGGAIPEGNLRIEFAGQSQVQVDLAGECTHVETCVGAYLQPSGPFVRRIAVQGWAAGTLDPLLFAWHSRGTVDPIWTKAGAPSAEEWALSGWVGSGWMVSRGTLRGALFGETRLEGSWSGEVLAFTVSSQTFPLAVWLSEFFPTPHGLHPPGVVRMSLDGAISVGTAQWRLDLSAEIPRRRVDPPLVLRCAVEGHGAAWRVDDCEVRANGRGALKVPTLQVEEWWYLRSLRLEAIEFPLEPLWEVLLAGQEEFVRGGVADGWVAWPVFETQALTVRGLAFLGEPVERAEIWLQPIGGGAFDVRLQFELERAGTIGLRGKIDERGEGALEIEPARFDLSQLGLSENLALEGVLQISGALTRVWPPIGEIQFHAEQVRFQGWDLGDVRGTADLSHLLWEVKASALWDQLRLRLQVEPQGNFAATLGADWSIEQVPWLARLGFAIESRGHSQAQVEIVTGKLERLAWEVDTLELRRGMQRVRLVRPVRGLVGATSAEIPSVEFELPSGGATFSVGWTRNRDLFVEMNCETDISWIAPLFDFGVVVGGRASIVGKAYRPIDGRWEANGTVHLMDLSVERTNLPPVSSAEVVLEIDGREFSKVYAAGLFGRGRFEVRGQVDFDRGPRLEWSVTEVEAEGLAGWEAVVRGQGTVDGTMREPIVRGEVVIVRAEYSRDLDLWGLLGWLRDRWFARRSTPAQPSRSAPVVLDLNVRSSEALVIRNNVADVEMWADVRVRGPVQHPQVRGQVGIVGGQVTFQQRTFEVTGGRIEFGRRRMAQPWLSITAETGVQTPGADYLIEVKVEGPVDAPLVQLSADDPTLSREDLLSLILFGQTRARLQSTGTMTSPMGLALRLAPVTGVTRPITEWLGIDQFEISAVQGREASALEPRVTVSKWITEELRTSVSSILGLQSRQFVQLEYRLARRVSLVGSWESATAETAGAFGGGVQFRVDTVRVPFSLCQ